MSRRFPFARRPMRGSAGGSALTAAQQLVAVFGSEAKMIWDASADVGLVSGNVDTWTDQKAGVILSAPAAGNRCAYNASNSNFNNQPTVASDFTTPTYLENATTVQAACGFSAGDLVYVAAICRETRAGASFNESGFVLATGAVPNAVWIATQSGTQEKNRMSVVTTGAVTITRTVVSVTTHLTEVYCDASLLHSVIDGVDSTAAAVGGFVNAATGASVGAQSSGVGPGAYEFGAIIVGKNVQAATMTAFRALSTARWGKP